MRNRTIAIKIAEVLEGGTKEKFYADLRNSLDLARRAANKSSSLCFAADRDLMKGGKCPKLYTYPMVSNEFPGVAVVAAIVCRSVESKYKQERWQVANGRKSICNYRSFPWPLLCNKSRNMLNVEDNGEFLTARIKLLGGWWAIRLAGGSNYRDQIKGIRIAIGSGKLGDSKIWIDRKHKAIIGVSVSLPETETKGHAGTLNVSTGRDTLILATKTRNDRPFAITGDEVKQWVAERDRRYYRLSQDRKSGKKRSQIKAAQRRIGDKWKSRMDTYIHQVTARIVEHAKRRKVAVLKFDGTIKSFLPKFPWFELATKLAYKCEDAGIEFVNATQSVAEPSTDKPHIYFKYAPSTGRVKIGKTSRKDGGRHGTETDSSEVLTILAVDNQPKTKLTQREKHFHAMFAAHRITKDGKRCEWFDGGPIIHWLREAQWFGNAGNHSQIAQVLPIDEFQSDTASSEPSVSVPEPERKRECSQDAIKCTGYSRATAMAP